MTQTEWEAENDFMRMLMYMEKKVSVRKFRMFTFACCRRVWHLMGDHPRSAIEWSERFVEGESCVAEMEKACRNAYYGQDREGEWNARRYAEAAAQDAYEKNFMPHDAIGGADSVASALAAKTAGTGNVFDSTKEPHHRDHCHLIRCVFGNPFRTSTLAPSHRTPTVVSLARVAYDERQLPSGELDKDRLAVLADALEEAGAPAELMAHLRGPGPHTRGCWGVDLCLGLS